MVSGQVWHPRFPGQAIPGPSVRWQHFPGHQAGQAGSDPYFV